LSRSSPPQSSQRDEGGGWTGARMEFLSSDMVRSMEWNARKG
jgi:hypothetical protein